jgi:hypothetical protein
MTAAPSPPFSVWRRLNAVPNMANWRRNRINEIEGFENDLRTLREELGHAASYVLWVKACERTRVYWSRFHAVGMLGSLPPRLERSGYEFLEIVTEILTFRDDVILSRPEKEELCRRYEHSMRLRYMLVQTLLSTSSSLEVRDVMWKQLDKLPGYSLHDADWHEPQPDVSEKQSSQRTLICGACWVLAQKLDSWRLELTNESGPFAHSIRNHHELVLGALQLFGLVLKTAALLGKTEAMSDTLAFKATIEERLLQPLAHLWQEINAAQSIPEDDLLGAEDLVPRHPLESKAHELVTSLLTEVIPLGDEAEQRFKAARAQITKQDWNMWITMGFEERHAFSLPDCSQSQRVSPVSWQSLVSEVLPRLGEVNCKKRLQDLHAVLSVTPVEESETNQRAMALVIVAGRLLELDFANSLSLVRKALLVDPPGTPPAYYELQLIGHVLRTVRQVTNRPLAETTLHDLISAFCLADPARWEGVPARNAMLARLLAAYFVVFSEHHVTTASALGQQCVKVAGNDPHFFQSLAKDTVRLLGRNQGMLGKIFLLSQLVPPHAVRWPEKLLELKALWSAAALWQVKATLGR